MSSLGSRCLHLQLNLAGRGVATTTLFLQVIWETLNGSGAFHTGRSFIRVNQESRVMQIESHRLVDNQTSRRTATNINIQAGWVIDCISTLPDNSLRVETQPVPHPSSRPPRQQPTDHQPTNNVPSFCWSCAARVERSRVLQANPGQRTGPLECGCIYVICAGRHRHSTVSSERADWRAGHHASRFRERHVVPSSGEAPTIRVANRPNTPRASQRALGRVWHRSPAPC